MEIDSDNLLVLVILMPLLVLGLKVMLVEYNQAKHISLIMQLALCCIH